MRSFKVMMAIIVSTVALLGFTVYNIYGKSDNPRNATKEKTESIQVTPKAVSAKDKINKSGPIFKGKLPWEKDKRFLAMKKKYNLSLRIAAFKTVLRDPLPGEEFNVSLAADLLAGSVVAPGNVFSQNSTVGPYAKERGFKEGPTYMGTRLTTTIGGGVCKIATTLYNIAILANLEIVERHNHGMIAPYVPPGQDATVSYGALDMKFRNNMASDIMIWAQNDEKANTLYMAVYGKEKAPKVTWGHETLETTKTHTIYRENPELAQGTEKVILEGYDGYLVKSWVNIEKDSGEKEVKDLGIDRYKPMPRLVEKGTKK